MPLASAEDVAAVADAVKQLKLDVDAAVMPQHGKMAARDAIAAVISGPLKAAKKADAKKKADAAVGAFEAVAKATPAGVAVTRVDFGADAKLWQKLQKSTLAKVAPESSFLVLSADDDKFVAYAAASKAHVAKGLDCREWCKAAADAAGGGKGGGKPEGANMVVMGNLDKVDDALAAALTFAAKFK